MTELILILKRIIVAFVAEDSCLGQGSYSCTSIMTKKQVGEETVYSAYTSILLFITKEVRTGTQAGADEEAMEGCSLLACFPCLLSLLSYRNKTTSPEMAPPTRGPPPWSLIEKMPYSQISWRHFLNWSSFLCDNSSCDKLTQNQPVQGALGTAFTEAVLEWGSLVSTSQLCLCFTFGSQASYLFFF